MSTAANRVPSDKASTFLPNRNAGAKPSECSWTNGPKKQVRRTPKTSPQCAVATSLSDPRRGVSHSNRPWRVHRSLLPNRHIAGGRRAAHDRSGCCSSVARRKPTGQARQVPRNSRGTRFHPCRCPYGGRPAPPVPNLRRRRRPSRGFGPPPRRQHPHRRPPRLLCPFLPPRAQNPRSTPLALASRLPAAYPNSSR